MAAALATSWMLSGAPARAQVTSEPSAVVFPDPEKFAHGFFTEGEIDLDALGRWNDADMGSPTFAGVLINRSEVPPFTGMGLVPDYTKDMNNVITHDHPGRLVVPAMYEVDVRLKTNAHMQIEYFVRVRDDDDRLLHNDSDSLYQTSPTLFQPAVMP